MINKSKSKTVKLFINKKFRIALATKIILTPILITQIQILSSLPKSILKVQGSKNIKNLVKNDQDYKNVKFKFKQTNNQNDKSKQKGSKIT